MSGSAVAVGSMAATGPEAALQRASSAISDAHAARPPGAGARRTPAALFFVADAMTLAYELALYALAFAPLALALGRWRGEHPLALLAIVLAGWLVAAVVLLLALVLTKRLLVGAVPSGRFFLTGGRAGRWMAADRLIKIMVRSPFRALVTENAFFRHAFYRGMGARIHPSLMLGNGVKFPEPWALRIGRNVLIGDEAVVSGHKVERGVVTLGEVEIGDDVLIGARALILPHVRIGDGAIVGAQSVVVQGTVIPARETWAGNPARRVDPFAAASMAKAAPMGARP